MAYRFNPPPNWPIDEPGWTPPPGWQPDPSWGPAPEGWNFWVPEEEDEEPAAQSPAPGAEPPLPTGDEEDHPRSTGASTPADEAGSSRTSAPQMGYGYSADDQGGHASGGSSAPAPLPGQSSADGAQGPAGNGGWSNAPNAEQKPPKGIVARFWWIGCIVLAFLAALLLIVGIVIATTVAKRSDDATAAPPSGEASTRTQDATTETADEDDAEKTVTPSDLPTVAASGTEQDVVGPDGKGTMTVSMEWKSAKDLDTSYEIEDSAYGEFLVVTAKLEVTDGTMSMGPGNFDVETPYGGQVSYDSDTFALKGAGQDVNAPRDFSAGEEYTESMIYEVKRAGGNKLAFDSYSDEYTWDVAK
ncbi:hypothetical protein DEO23_10830 [Brachybacterium endophyticum]|uniref:DUF4352 domain-containing protein n=1 Tax=Brachybacterium endophyticum TaxID=2182385 RepID=A0A2U2RIJ8_9MICO|nr:hypothetical protein [Brachybacterium endophyticum]PWH05699.1 hypothetical protein DEO23_10830 [Brachybacterium endophyticum]